MASEKQTEANRRNALLSKGPVTPAGKAISRMNALKTGIDADAEIIRGEDPAALELLTQQYYERFQPEGPEEVELLDTIVSNAWRLRRLRKAEAGIWDSSMEHGEKIAKQFGHPESAYPQADAYCGESTGKALDRVHCRIAALERSLRTALETLIRLRKSGVILPTAANPEPLHPEPPQPEPHQPNPPEAVPGTKPISNISLNPQSVPVSDITPAAAELVQKTVVEPSARQRSSVNCVPAIDFQGRL